MKLQVNLERLLTFLKIVVIRTFYDRLEAQVCMCDFEAAKIRSFCNETVSSSKVH